MPAITRDSLMTLEAYARERKEFRARVLAHKRDRTVHLGDHVTLLFEDELTIRYQVQEMLRIEKMFDEAGIQAELDTYNPLVPDGSNLKATMLLEYEDAEARRDALAQLKGIEDAIWVQVDGFPAVHAIADEDLDRENDEKTSAVHFVRFELSSEMVAAFKAGRVVAMGVEHANYRAQIAALPANVHAALRADFAS
jgi:predicted regulator of Ras-like GTPase activity (Roadblock/LC7/MglB family)